ncbi:ABC transporter substrate-binding protein [Neobacillus sp. GCM10023253]|uniref:ABC transporter substrate-binding protein n=1 Tax=Neobacillus sp. GCM10023253 TaxID=3252644 RepID=UPI00360629C6
MKKKLTSALALILTVILLVSCSAQTSKNQSTKGDPKDGKKQAQGVTDKEIIVGLTGPQTGPVAEYDKVRRGVQAYFNYVNDNGGVNGRKLKLIAYDDQYQPAKTLQSIQRLIEQDKVFSIIYPIGTANIAASQQLLEKTGIPVTGLGTGADKFVNPPIKNVFGGTFNYVVEAKVFLDYSVNKLNAKKIAIAYQNDDFGKQGLEAIKKNIGKYPGVSIVKEVPFLATDKEFSSQAQQLKEAKADVIIMNTTPAPAAALRKEMHKIGASDTPFIVSQTGGADKNQFNLAGKDAWEGIISSLQYPNYEEQMDNPGVKKYVEYVTKDFGKESLGALSEGAWSTAQVYVEGLKRAGDDLSWENFIKKMETFDKWDGSFYPSVTYTAEHRYGNTSLFLVQAKAGDLVPVTGNIHYDPEKDKIEYEK